MQFSLTMQKQVLPVVREKIMQKASEKHHNMFGSMGSVGLVGCEWCGRVVVGTFHRPRVCSVQVASNRWRRVDGVACAAISVAQTATVG